MGLPGQAPASAPAYLLRLMGALEAGHAAEQLGSSSRLAVQPPTPTRTPLTPPPSPLAAPHAGPSLLCSTLLITQAVARRLRIRLSLAAASVSTAKLPLSRAT